MKSIILFLGAAAFSWLIVGCASHPVAVSPVGPNPRGVETDSPEGRLDVFSAWRSHSEGDDPPWFQPTDYYVYDQHGQMVEHVGNSVGRYNSRPRTVMLPPGNYIVKAQAQEYFRVEIPVLIEAGRTTRVHLDDAWQPPADSPKNEFVSLPDGHPVGWGAQAGW